MEENKPQLQWSAQFRLANVSPRAVPTGDRILLPQSALEQLLAAAPTVQSYDASVQNHTTSFDPYNPYSFAAERQARSLHRNETQQLPHPLTFRLVSPASGKIVYAGIREFSAADETVVLSDFLSGALGFSKPLDDSDAPSVTVHAQQIPKGTFVKLRPLEAGYDEDWKALLEEYLRKNFTTLTRGELLVIPGARSTSGSSEEFRFLVDEIQPQGDAICIVDTDLEVDIEALNEEQARETLKRIAAKKFKAPGSGQGSSIGGELSLFQPQRGQVIPGEYVDYEIPSWSKSAGIEVQLNAADEAADLDLFLSPLSARQRERPREDVHVFADLDTRPSKRIRLAPTNVEVENADSLWISVRAYSESGGEPSGGPVQYEIRVDPLEGANPLTRQINGASSPEPPDPSEMRCKNCHQMVPKQSMMLHENFCLRNNILCPKGCGRVFQKRSDAFKKHWHCQFDDSSGDTEAAKTKHDAIFHPHGSLNCPACEISQTFSSIPLLAAHRTSTCPGKLILCRFCHLQVPQEGDPNDPNPPAELLLSGLTPHELADGGRTTECHLCAHIIRLRDMDTHLRHHDLERKSRPTPRMCRNVNCGRTLDVAGRNGDTRAGSRMGQGAGNDIGLCSTCFGPLYVSVYDPEGKALKRRVERRYLQQLLSGCGKEHCRNEFCKNGRKRIGISDGSAVSTKDALPMIKPQMNGLQGGATPLQFCVDQPSQTRRGMAGLLRAEADRMPGAKKYDLPWVIAALEAENGDSDKARDWLKNFAPSVDELM